MFVRILNSEMELATGCTEPGAVALTAAEAGAALRKAGGTRVEAVTVRASINIIKNAMSAGIPGTSYQGMDYAAAIGAVGGDPVHLLEVMNYVPREQMEEAAALVKAGKVKVEVAQVPQKLYVEVVVTADGHTGRAVVRDLHTNVVLVEQDGVATLDKQHTDPAAAGDSDVVTPEQIAEFLTVRSIWDYCTEELDPLHDPIDIIRSAVQVNTTISNEGLSKEYGLAIGRNLELNCRKGLMTRDLTTNAMVIASAGADARMAGAPVSVVANSGSGNQGITATMPVVATAGATNASAICIPKYHLSFIFDHISKNLVIPQAFYHRYLVDTFIFFQLTHILIPSIPAIMLLLRKCYIIVTIFYVIGRYTQKIAGSSQSK